MQVKMRRSFKEKLKIYTSIGWRREEPNGNILLYFCESSLGVSHTGLTSALELGSVKSLTIIPPQGPVHPSPLVQFKRGTLIVTDSPGGHRVTFSTVVQYFSRFLWNSERCQSLCRNHIKHWKINTVMDCICNWRRQVGFVAKFALFLMCRAATNNDLFHCWLNLLIQVLIKCSAARKFAGKEWQEWLSSRSFLYVNPKKKTRFMVRDTSWWDWFSAKQ